MDRVQGAVSCADTTLNERHVGASKSVPQAAQVASQDDQLLASRIWVPEPAPGTAVLSPPRDEDHRLLQVLESLGRSERVLEVLLSFIDQRCRLFTSEGEEQRDRKSVV